MHFLCFQSFGTNEISAKEEKRFGIYENESCNICVVLSGHSGKLAAAKLSKTAGQKFGLCFVYTPSLTEVG